MIDLQGELLALAREIERFTNRRTLARPPVKGLAFVNGAPGNDETRAALEWAQATLAAYFDQYAERAVALLDRASVHGIGDEAQRSLLADPRTRRAGPRREFEAANALSEVVAVLRDLAERVAPVRRRRRFFPSLSAGGGFWSAIANLNNLASLIAALIVVGGAAAGLYLWLGSGDGGGTTSGELRPPPEKAPASLPQTGPRLEVFNKVTNGREQMREDAPAYLSTTPRNYCADADCAIPDTELSTGDTVGPAICQRLGPLTTNGDTRSPADDQNPGLFSSRRWYGIRRPDDTIGYISEVWVRRDDRGGLRLPQCPSSS
jgi:hypothetical protein